MKYFLSKNLELSPINITTSELFYKMYGSSLENAIYTTDAATTLEILLEHPNVIFRLPGNWENSNIFDDFDYAGHTSYKITDLLDKSSLVIVRAVKVVYSKTTMYFLHNGSSKTIESAIRKKIISDILNEL